MRKRRTNIENIPSPLNARIISSLHKWEKKKGRRGRERDDAHCISVLADFGIRRLHLRHGTSPKPPKRRYGEGRGVTSGAGAYGGWRWLRR
ncbi:hypothetical protein ES288_A12G029200v1 [Gossypium darwinii]|uniref:Uncharacterized protein n=1 Tax=Gossypium darwinii TaxID=34276 RepID=A0A5D2E597_GOSDA|nr:hypothetical protein ES288_A12G029200v1 [Gossypium darwinii]